MDCIWPSSLCVQEHRPCRLGDIPNGSLGDAILEMGVDTTKGKCLLVCIAVLLECIVCKSPVVGMVVFDVNAVLFCKSLESYFGLDGFGGRHAGHQMDESQPRIVVDKYGGGVVSTRSEPSLELSKESSLCRL
jgi:hypothetical protein